MLSNNLVMDKVMYNEYKQCNGNVLCNNSLPIWQTMASYFLINVVIVQLIYSY